MAALCGIFMAKKMAAENKVRFIHSGNLNVPQINNNRSTLIAALDAVLVEGINLPSISSAVIDGSTIIITFVSNHSLISFQVVRLSGFMPVDLNADFRVVGVPATNQISINHPASVASITAIGAAFLAPLGYERVFSGTNKAVYRNANSAAQHRPFLRVDNSLDPLYNSGYACYAKVGILKTCTGIDDVSGAQVPFDSTSPQKNWVATGSGSSVINGWARWYYSRFNYNNSPSTNISDEYQDQSNGSKGWTIVGDETAFYLLLNPWIDYPSNKLIYGFGVYDVSEPINNPYFLSCSMRYTSANTDYDFTGTYKFVTATPFVLNSSNSKVLLFEDVVNKNQVLATTDTKDYNTGSTNVYLNSNLFQETYFLTDGGWLIGKPPFIRYALNARTEVNNTSLAVDDRMFLCNTVALNNTTNGRVFFDLGVL